MKKLGIVVVLLIFLFGLMVVIPATSYDSNKHEISIDIHKGWNLIPAYAEELQKDKANLEIKFSDFKYGYIYDIEKKAYVFVLKDGDWTQRDFGLGEWVLTASMWVYSEKQGSYILRYGDSGFNNNLFELNKYNLKKGWNFIFATPEMIGYSMNEIKGTCNYNKIYTYGYEAGNVDWMDLLNNPNFMDEKLTSNSVGYGLVIKVSSDCQLGTSSSSVSPPSLPGTEITPSQNSEFPDKIGDFSVKTKNLVDKVNCGQLEGKEVCVAMGRIEYTTQASGYNAVHVLPTKITSGLQAYKDYIKAHNSGENTGGISGVYRGVEPWELYWFTNDNNYDMIATQTYEYTSRADGGISSKGVNASIDNEVIEWALEKFPPITI